MKYLSLTLFFLWFHGMPVFAQEENLVKIARLSEGDDEGLTAIQNDFVKRNPGYDLHYLSAVMKVDPKPSTQVIFVQEGGGTATITTSKSGKRASKVSVGDALLLRNGEYMEADSLLGLLVFTVPEKPGEELPPFIRPDWDLNITDTPGGCATETNAYRRILLTWKGDVGNYLYHAINAHRVRIMDSFSHYHPEDRGFDEFYLVQMVQPGAKLYTSEQVSLISDPDKIKKSQIDGLMQEHALKVGDLVYLPRGVMHRGFGGVLAQVITVPGFIPGSELGVDHFLKQINEKFNLRGKDAIPFNRQASVYQVVK